MNAIASDIRTVRLSIPARPEYITLGRLALTGLGRLYDLSEETLGDLKLALTEACSNSVRHAYDGHDGHVDIRFELKDDRLIVEVADDGSGFVPAGEVEPVDGDELSEGGLGIAIIRSVADDVEIGTGPGGRGSRLRFVKLL